MYEPERSFKNAVKSTGQSKWGPHHLIDKTFWAHNSSQANIGNFRNACLSY